MAVVKNGGISLVSSSNQTGAFRAAENDVVAGDDHRLPSTKPTTAAVAATTQSSAEVKSTKPLQSTDETFNIKFGTQPETKILTLQQNISDGKLTSAASNQNQPSQNLNAFDQQQQHSVKGKFTDGNHHLNNGHGGNGRIGDGSEGFKKEMRDLEEMLFKLNPMAKEFVPPSLVTHNHHWLPQAGAGHFGYSANSFIMHDNAGISNGNSIRRKNGYNNGKRRMNSRTSMAQREEVIRRTVYVSDVDHHVTEEQLAALFHHCGQVVDCRVCGDPNSVLRFAFIEFTDEEGASNALSLSGTMLGFYPVRVQPSKTAIAPVNPTFLPRSEDEREMCARTIYCTNIDKKVAAADVKLFFESMCGEVQRLRLLGDHHHSTRIAFVEFVMAESAIAALNCSGAIMGSLPLRISPSKTPVRSRPPRPSMH